MKTGFCVSGQGRVVEALLAARDAGLLRLRGARALVDRPGPFLEVGRQRGVEVELLDSTRYRDREEFRADLSRHLLAWDVDALFLTFDWLVPPTAIARFGPHTVNLHMSLLPLFPGMGAIRKAAASGGRVAGITYHRIDAGIDTGPIIAQAVQSSTGLTAAELGRALFRRAVPLGMQVVRWLESGRLAEGASRYLDIEGAEYDDGPNFPKVDADIAEFALAFLSDRYP